MRNTLIGLMLMVATVASAQYTPSSDEDTSASKTYAALEVNGDITLANDETIDNAVDAVVQVSFDDDAVVLGTVKVESENAAASISAGDELRVDYAAQNDATQEVTYARIVIDLTDETDTTEDGTHEVWVMAAGTLTKIASVDASGITIVGDVAGTTIGGITQASLLDKAATETVSGAWTFDTVAKNIDASGEVEAATLGIENGVADGYFQRTGTALEYVEGGVTNVLDANVGA